MEDQLPKSNKCPKCESTKIIPDARVLSQIGYEIQVQSYAKPDAKLFKKGTTATVRALICGACGYVELFIPNAKRFVDEHRSKAD